jgi:uncharacterized membrane protein YccC
VNPLALLAAAPAVPYEKAGRFVAAAFIVLFAVVVIYIGIMAVKLQRLERDLSELNSALDAKDAAQGLAGGAPAPERAPEAPARGHDSVGDEVAT